MEATICRTAHFNAAHRLYNPAMSQEENAAIFGKCSYENYHGHNYMLKVYVSGLVEPDTGCVMNLSDLKKLIKEYVEDPMDHRNLNLDVAEFKELIPTAENIAYVIYDRLKPHIPEHLTLGIELQETVNNTVFYPMKNW